MAAAYGDYPEIAVPRMSWARDAVATAFAGNSSSPTDTVSYPAAHSFAPSAVGLSA
jgi:hypothetical protein